MLPKKEWARFALFYAIAAVIGWFVFRVTYSHLLVAIMVGTILIDLVVRLYLYHARGNPNRFTRFLRTDTMPETTTHGELWWQVTLSTIFYLFLAAGCAYLLAMPAFESLAMPILMAALILLILVPRRYWSLRRYYRPIEVPEGVHGQQILEFDAQLNSIYGSRLLSYAHFVLVMTVISGLAIWLV